MNRYEINAKGPRAELLIYGDIGSSWDDPESVDATKVIDQLEGVKGDIDVRINSFGGSVADGIAIFNALRRHDGQVTTHIDGVAYSMASLIAMAGSQVQMASNAMMMIHAPWGGAIGNATDMRDMADILDKHAEAMIGSYLREGGPDRATVEAWLKDGEDHYFTATDAAELGFIDYIADAADLGNIAAAIKDSSFRKPAARQRRVEQEVAAMADTETTGGPDSPDNSDIVAKHSKTVEAAKSAGAKAESRRRKMVADVFAGFYDGDPMNPVTAIYDECIDDIHCSELETRRKLQAHLANRSSDPVIAPESYGVASEPTAPPRASRHLGGAVAGMSNDEKVYGAMQDAVEYKFGLKPDIDRQNLFAGLSFGEMARVFAKHCGVKGVEFATPDQVMRTILDPQAGLRMNIGPQSIQMQHATGDFPGILANVIDKAIRVNYEQSMETWRSVSRIGSVNDFRQAQRPAMSAADDLLMVPEGGEYKYGEQSDVFEYLQANKFGRIFSITREALLADDLQAFSDQAMRMAMAANRLVGDKVWNTFIDNPTLNQDGTPVFDATHGNIGTAGPPSVTTLSEARKLMRVQTDSSGKSTLNLAPALLIVPPGWETEALTLITAQNLDYTVNSGDEITQQQAANQFGQLLPVVENRLGGATGNDTGWYMQSAPSGPVPFIEVAFVRGQETPVIDSREGWSVDGLEYKVRQEFAVAPLSYQSVVYNAGA